MKDTSCRKEGGYRNEVRKDGGRKKGRKEGRKGI